MLAIALLIQMKIYLKYISLKFSQIRAVFSYYLILTTKFWR